jgi:hypothetical protein
VTKKLPSQLMQQLKLLKLIKHQPRRKLSQLRKRNQSLRRSLKHRKRLRRQLLI